MTTLYGLPHGHAVALCLPKVWWYMKDYNHIAHALGAKNYGEAISFFERLIHKMGIFPPQEASEDDLDILVKSVNAKRLHNNPIALGKETIRELYTKILEV
jgi:alcohol dehydrogenase class IV